MKPEILLERIKNADLSVAEVCREAGVTKDTASRFFNNKRDTRIGTVVKIVEAYKRLREKKLRARKK